MAPTATPTPADPPTPPATEADPAIALIFDVSVAVTLTAPAEIALLAIRLTPPFGISCFVIKATIDDPNITLNDVFMGALPFAAVMLGVLVLLIVFPQISLALL